MFHVKPLNKVLDYLYFKLVLDYLYWYNGSFTVEKVLGVGKVALFHFCRIAER